MVPAVTIKSRWSIFLEIMLLPWQLTKDMVNWFKSFKTMTKTEVAVFVLTLGASIILGFLSFSGMYVLWPILGLAIGAFVLSVVYEGEVYYQNIKGSLEKLFKPNYLKRQLAKECLRELLCKMEVIERLEAIIKTLRETEDCSDEFYERYAEFLSLYERVVGEQNEKTAVVYSLNDFQEKSKYTSEQIKRLAELRTPSFYCVSREDLDRTQSEIDEIVSSKFRADAATFLEDSVLKTLKPAGEFPDFLYDYAHHIRIHHQYSDHTNLETGSKAEQLKLAKDLDRLDDLFLLQLFPNDGVAIEKASIGSDIQVVKTRNEIALFEGQQRYFFVVTEGGLVERGKQGDLLARNKADIASCYKDLSPDEQIALDTLFYVGSLRSYLDGCRAEWQVKHGERAFWFQITQALSAIAGLFMILGSTYLLVEAFAVLPLVAALPLGLWPVLIVPMAFIAGSSFGLLTYNAITDMINDDSINARIRKIKADLKQGLTFRSGLMMVLSIGLLALTLVLTICTAGTWWTVVKYTRPLFSWMQKIPTILIGTLAFIVGLAGLAFNLGNTLQTINELEQESGPHPWDLTLLSLEATATLPEIHASKSELILAKQGSNYKLYGCYDGEWGWRDLQSNPVFERIDFDKKRMPFSLANLRLYRAMTQSQAHTFFPKQENIWQRLNPFRFLLLITYVPLRVALFLGHLVSISVMMDRLPGLNEIVSAILGFVAELFEDLHYFVRFAHAHKNDIRSLLDEQNHPDGHNHSNDLPTKGLKVLFYPLIYLAAWWASATSDYETVDPSEPVSGDSSPEDESVKTVSHGTRQLSFERALEMMQGKPARKEVKLAGYDINYVLSAHKESDSMGDEQVGHSENYHVVKNLAGLERRKKQVFDQYACCNGGIHYRTGGLSVNKSSDLPSPKNWDKVLAGRVRGHHRP